MSKSTLHPLSRVLPSRPLGPMRVPARALAWFGIGLGLFQLAMPGRLARAAGMANAPRLMRAYGLREIGTGVGILTSKDPAPWLWARFAGDALDIATVASGLVTQRRPLRTVTSIAMLAGVAYIDMKVAEKAPPKRKLEQRSLRDYSTRSGFPKPAHEMRGIALRPSSPVVREPVAAAAAASPARALMQAGEPASSTSLAQAELRNIPG